MSETAADFAGDGPGSLFLKVEIILSVILTGSSCQIRFRTSM